MSERKNKSKLIKRRLSDQSEVPQKRPRNVAQKSSSFKDQCSGTRKQDILRERDKKTKSGNTLVQVQETVPSQSRVQDVSGPEPVEKSHNVNEKRTILKRSRKRPGKFILKDDTGEETIIEIDNSSQPTNNRSAKNIFNRTSLTTHKRNECIEERLSGDSFRSCKSLVTVSEVSSSETSLNSNTPMQQRLNRLKRASTSNSSTKTLTPNQTLQSPIPSSVSPPKGLKIPLKRNLVKRPFEEFDSSSSSSITSKDNTSDKSEESMVLKSPEESRSILKKIALASTSVLAVRRAKSSYDSVDSQLPVTRQTVVHHNQSEAPEKPALLKFAENLASKRLKRLRDSLKNTENERETTKHISPLKRTLEVESTHVAKDQKLFEKPSNFIPNLLRNNNKSKAKSPVQSPEQKFNIILPSSSVSNRLKLIKEKQRQSLEEVQVSVFGKHSSDNIQSISSRTQCTSPVLIQKQACESQIVSEGPDIFKKDTSTSSLQDRLLRITNNNKSHLKKYSSMMETDLSQEGLLSQELVNVENKSQKESGISNIEMPTTSTNKSVYIENWMTSAYPTSRVSDAYQNDSLLVNVDDTLLNKSELMTEQQEDVSMEWDAISESAAEEKPTPQPQPPPVSTMAKEPFICIVTDTNVFLHDLPKIRELLALSLSNKHKLKIFIPWMVQQEIDNFKDSFSSKLRPMALAAQKLINSQLLQPDAKVIGQSITDVCDQVDLGKAPDDKILACLLQAGKKYESVILLSNDIGLRNKAISNNFKAYTPKEILAMIRNSKCLRIKIRLQNFLSQVIFYCCKNAFGDLCTKMEVLQGCPWPFEECLKRFKKYWSTAFQQVLLKHCYKCIDELLCLCSQGDILDSDQAKLTKFKDKVKEFLFYLQDIEHFNTTSKKMRNEVDNIVNSQSAM
ncbi:transcriptional protein SWT1 [Anthonomus grandis grandis]|uniref:transcriptional protein SWT1 n=1 Tax=Anthonomus grandis grandis TaxID=2921223 RepID=UPI002165FEE7|nr:transcriptional protein SWT1 [Anthonomus grandis grandis]